MVLEAKKFKVQTIACVKQPAFQTFFRTDHAGWKFLAALRPYKEANDRID
jgi:hypothetical protein